MRLAVFFVTLFIVAALWISRSTRTRSVAEGTSTRSPRGENSSVCPWREPQRDLRTLFPEATEYVTETRILSQFMGPIHKRLNRPMTVDENPLRIYRATDGTRAKGAILVKRVKGEHGGIELVTGIDPQGRVCGVLIQSQREPDSVAQVITNWLPHFVGKTAESALQPGGDLPEVAPDARTTANAIAEGVRRGLIVFSFAENALEAETPRTKRTP
jgi:hypothetical protein